MEKSTSKMLRKILWAGVFIALGVVSLLANHQVVGRSFYRPGRRQPAGQSPGPAL
ncbi:hypothetical protein HY768_00010 [candidate division TA06 bacterium]|uniref:Uncharacterized protein n=1 Tax=candidate division TA06 bacterium TaxID=2250710 RepID=A0A933I945_UNCT6|nr:hypothetical protein [candidate division TA06 bacterium]